MSPFRPANDPERRKYQNPEAILQQIGLKPGMTVVDMGCGGGFFALPAARIVGKKGKLYASDINSEGIDDLRRLAGEDGLANIEFSIGQAEDLVLGREHADIVFFGLVVVHLAHIVTIHLEEAGIGPVPPGASAVFC